MDALVAELLVGDGGGGATRLRALTWLVPVKITPFWFTTSTVPSALIAPWISLGFADAPTTRFSAASDAFCLNCSVVFRPTLKLSQFRMARDCVCSMVTTCRPSATLFAAPGAFPIWPARPRLPTGRPASAHPARRRRWPMPPRCAACCAATAAAVRFRLSSERCAAGATAPAAGWRCRRRQAAVRQAAERCTADCAAPLSANQPGLKARDCACAAPAAPPAISNAATACDKGVGRHDGGWRSRRE